MDGRVFLDMSQEIYETRPMPVLSETAPYPPSDGGDGTSVAPPPPTPADEEAMQVATGDVSEFFPDAFVEQHQFLTWEEEQHQQQLALLRSGQLTAFYPGYDYTQNLIYCDLCVKYNHARHMNVIRLSDGMYLLRRFMCGTCIERNRIRLQ